MLTKNSETVDNCLPISFHCIPLPQPHPTPILIKQMKTRATHALLHGIGEGSCTDTEKAGHAKKAEH